MDVVVSCCRRQAYGRLCKLLPAAGVVKSLQIAAGGRRMDVVVSCCRRQARGSSCKKLSNMNNRYLFEANEPFE